MVCFAPLLAVSLLLGAGQALLEDKFVAFEKSKGAIDITSPLIISDIDDPVTVHIAARALSGDYEAVTGSKPAVFQYDGSDNLRQMARPAAVIASMADSSLIKRLEDDGKIEVDDIRGKWEAFKTVLVKKPFPGIANALVITGSDKRGTAFGVYTLSEQMGQSPLHFWGDVPATQRDKIFALPKTTSHGEPSVKYRGIFINDEAPALTSWWDKHGNTTDYTFDTEFYALVFDFIARLKGNFMWPAMWGSFIPRPGRVFWTDDPGNIQLADDYGIVMSTSHHEPMQRATNEWNETTRGEWNWVDNGEKVRSFMEEGVRRAGGNESYFTLGMRGLNDGSVEAEDPVKTLKEIIAAQRDMLAEVHGNETAVRQVWTIYKEVQILYEGGVIPPEDVTLMFADDNWGNTRRFPTDEELERSGGIGLYFHLDYVGDPKSFKWQNTNNFPKLYKDLYHAYERGTRQIWVFNVGDIKPVEIPLSFCMDMAWDASKITFDSVSDYVHALVVRDFGSENADEIAWLLEEFSRLVGIRKFEITMPETYSVLNFHEAERMLDRWAELAERATTLHDTLPEATKNAFYDLVVYPSVAGHNYHQVMIGRGLNQQYAIERRNSANTWAQNILDAFERDYDLIEDFHALADGKWDGMMSTPKFDHGLDSWRPPSRDVLMNVSFVQRRQQFDYGFGNLGIAAEGDEGAAWQGRICASINPSLPTSEGFEPQLQVVTPYGPDKRTVTLFHRGDYKTTIPWKVEVPHDWVQVSEMEGAVSETVEEQTLEISVDWDAVPDDFNDEVLIRVSWEPEPYFDNIHLPVHKTSAPGDFVGFPDVGGIISIEAPHYQRSSDGDVAFETMKGLGTRASGSVALRPFKAARADTSLAEGAWVEYDIYLFSRESVTASVFINSALDTDPNLLMRYALGVDGEEAEMKRVLQDPEEVGDVPPDWEATVADGVWKRDVDLGELDEGKHTLRWRVNSPEVYLEKIVLGVGGDVPESYLGPPETTMLG